MTRHEEMYRGYKLIAQYWDGIFQGRAWAGGQMIKATGQSIDDVIESLKNKIPTGGAKIPFSDPKPTEVVATANSLERVFHRTKCGWMSKVSAENEIRFANRESAIRQGFSACTYCHP